MNRSNNRISHSSTTELLALAAQLQEQKSQDYIPSELIQAATEAGISPDSLQEALQLMYLKQTQDQSRRRNLRLIISSGVAGAAIALASVWGSFTLNQHSTIGGLAFSVANAHPAHPTPPGAPVPNDYTTTYNGRVQQYLLNPEGRVDGLLLDNKIQVKFPPHLSDRLTKAIAPNDEVSIIGVAGTPTQFGQEIRATQIVNLRTQQTIANQPPTVPPSPPANRVSYSSLSVDGIARHWLVGHRGELKGVILSSGVVVKFPPHVGDRLVSIIEGSDKVQVQGFGTRNTYGQVIEATTLTVNGQNVAIAPGTGVKRYRSTKP
ncbi:hypothetical protein WA1_13245 [Scytonema hofmannii PCC 7110]|uniref:DUF5666 domain-containing protein n=1 Tax=Scytonema hofmannii PCC 7110 TaxID=128403 RepID=A0A139XED0_9CYAN|nr:hypothetical protein [Scytonema hofmannii]KYC43061.1 hypothetical protein WA1_13245 [Scytonema hofmannii PCC 7110]